MSIQLTYDDPFTSTKSFDQPLLIQYCCMSTSFKCKILYFPFCSSQFITPFSCVYVSDYKHLLALHFLNKSLSIVCYGLHILPLTVYCMSCYFMWCYHGSHLSLKHPKPLADIDKCGLSRNASGNNDRQVSAVLFMKISHWRYNETCCYAARLVFGCLSKCVCGGG